jgi:hypothetical protein
MAASHIPAAALGLGLILALPLLRRLAPIPRHR